MREYSTLWSTEYDNVQISISVRGFPQLLSLNVHAIHGTQVQGVTEQMMGVALLTFVQNVDQSLIKGRSAEHDVIRVTINRE